MLIDDSVGRITAAKIDVVARNGRIKGRNPLIYMHSAASDAREIMGWSLPSTPKIARAFVDDLQFDLASATAILSLGHAGLPASSSIVAAGKGEIERAITYHRTTLGGSSDPVVLMGTSMGSTNCLVYALQHPGEVAALILFSPVWDLAGYYAANTQNIRADIGTAWNKTYPAALPSEADIHALTVANAPNIPMYLVDASNDPYTTTYNSSKYTTWRNAWGNVTRQALGAVGHGEGTTAAADMTPIKNWLQSVL